MKRPHRIIEGETLGGWEVLSVDYYTERDCNERAGDVCEQRVTVSLGHVGAKAEVSQAVDDGAWLRDSRAVEPNETL